MSKELHIGEVAQLLGITTKAIRHYQKIGLLRESERTASGYRLFNAEDLLRLQRIRKLQALGLSLKQIKAVLGQPGHEHSLREVLQSLEAEISTQLRMLEERREKIMALLEEECLVELNELSFSSPTFEIVKEQLLQSELGDFVSQVSPALLEQEMKAYALIDNLHWPELNKSQWQKIIEQLLHYMSEQPAAYRQLLLLGERLVNIADLPHNAPEVAQLISDMVEYLLDHPIFYELVQFDAREPNLLMNALADLFHSHYSPSQLYVLKTAFLYLEQSRP